MKKFIIINEVEFDKVLPPKVFDCDTNEEIKYVVKIVIQNKKISILKYDIEDSNEKKCRIFNTVKGELTGTVYSIKNYDYENLK